MRAWQSRALPFLRFLVLERSHYGVLRSNSVCTWPDDTIFIGDIRSDGALIADVVRFINYADVITQSVPQLFPQFPFGGGVSEVCGVFKIVLSNQNPIGALLIHGGSPFDKGLVDNSLLNLLEGFHYDHRV